MSCKAKVCAPGNVFHTYGCSRDAVQDGYCRQHHPDAVAARRAKRSKLADERYARDMEKIHRPRLLEESLTKLVRHLSEYLQSDPCDHSVGICRCEPERDLVEAAKLLPREGLPPFANILLKEEEDLAEWAAKTQEE